MMWRNIVWSVASALAAVCYAMPGVVIADNTQWDHTVNFRHGDGDYSGSPIHEAFSAQWLYLTLAKPQEQSYTLGGGRLLRTFASPIPDVEEETIFGRADHTFTAASGRWRPGLYMQRSNISGTSNKGDVRVDVIEPILHWAQESTPIDLELGYAHSRYDQGFIVRQWTPAVGYSSGPLRLQLRGFFINSDSPSTIARGSSEALETTLFLRRARGSVLAGIYAQYLSGERIYPVDRELFYIIPMANRQYDSWRVGLNLNFGEHWQLGIMRGKQTFATNQFDFEMDFIGSILTARF